MEIFMKRNLKLALLMAFCLTATACGKTAEKPAEKKAEKQALNCNNKSPHKNNSLGVL